MPPPQGEVARRVSRKRRDGRGPLFPSVRTGDFPRRGKQDAGQCPALRASAQIGGRPKVAPTSADETSARSTSPVQGEVASADPLPGGCRRGHTVLRRRPQGIAPTTGNRHWRTSAGCRGRQPLRRGTQRGCGTAGEASPSPTAQTDIGARSCLPHRGRCRGASHASAVTVGAPYSPVCALGTSPGGGSKMPGNARRCGRGAEKGAFHEEE